MASASTTTSGSGNDKNRVLMYDIERCGVNWYVYWLGGANILGITDFGRQTYTIQLDQSERKKFMGNMADSLLKNHWEKIFQNKQFKIEKADHESAQLKYTPSKVLELPRVEREEDIIEANKKMFIAYIQSTRHLLNVSDKTPHKRAAVEESNNGSPEKKPTVQLKQKRHVPGRVLQTPIVFEDPPETEETPPENSNAIDISPTKA